MLHTRYNMSQALKKQLNLYTCFAVQVLRSMDLMNSAVSCYNFFICSVSCLVNLYCEV